MEKLDLPMRHPPPSPDRFSLHRYAVRSYLLYCEKLVNRNSNYFLSTIAKQLLRAVAVSHTSLKASAVTN